MHIQEPSQSQHLKKMIMQLIISLELLRKELFMSTQTKIISSKDFFDATTKVAVIGDSSVGKTNLLLRYTNAKYQMTHIATIGIDFKTKKLELDGFKLKMQIWDTAGQERYRNLSGNIYQGAQAVVLVYAINSRKSFESLQKWMKDVQEKSKSALILAIVGNKSDLKREREVTIEQGIKIAEKYNATVFMETSAKEGTNVDHLFQTVGQIIKDRVLASEEKIKHNLEEIQTRARSTRTIPETPNKVALTFQNKEAKKKKKGCC